MAYSKAGFYDFITIDEITWKLFDEIANAKPTAQNSGFSIKSAFFAIAKLHEYWSVP
jgi:hypothetical protein